MKYKKIYLEITNACNLTCPFCAAHTRPKAFMSYDDFKSILAKIEDYTGYLYFHVLGEPLLHPLVNDFIDYASKSFKINITTNGFLIDKIKNNSNIRQLNISLHSYDYHYGISIDEYLDKIFTVCDSLSSNTFISYRIWTNSLYTEAIINKINKKYNQNLDYNNLSNIELANNIFLSIHDEFVWPNKGTSLNHGSCKALKNHIGVLVDGSVIPCCLDASGDIIFGNIKDDDLESIIKSDRYQHMLDGFNKNIRYESLCQRCNFKTL